jgi:hypothetical protein
VHELARGRIDRGRCRREFLERFSDSRMAQDYLRIYRRLAHGAVPAHAHPAGRLDGSALRAPQSPISSPSSPSPPSLPAHGRGQRAFRDHRGHVGTDHGRDPFV